MNGNRLDWIRFGVEGFLLSIIASAVCACAAELNVLFMPDGYNFLSLVFVIVAVILLAIGIIGAALIKTRND